MPDKVTSGNIIEPRAELWNDMVDAANSHKRQRLGLARKPRPPKITPPDRVKVQNKTGGNLAAGSVVELGNFLLSDEVNGYLWLEGDTPSDLDGVHVILRQAIPNDDFGEAQIIGTVVARVNVNDSGHKYAKAEVGETELDSTDEAGPIRILHAPGTGSQLCAVLLGSSGGQPMALRAGVLTEDLLAGESALVDEFDLDAFGNKVYTGEQHEVWDTKLNAGQLIEAETIIDYAPLPDGKYRWIAAHCAVSDTLPEEGA